MKKLKNNKGITGVDITASIVILIISIGIISAMYSKYINNSKQIKRNTEASKIAMDFIQYIDKTDFNKLDETFDEQAEEIIEDGVTELCIVFEEGDDLLNIFGTEIKNMISQIPTGYTIKLTKQEELEGIAMKLNVEVSYKLVSKEEKISLTTTKTKLAIGQVNPPDMEASEVKNTSKEENIRYILKYSNLKQGYIEGKVTDDDWYSISGKRYPVVVYTKEDSFDINGVVNLEKCEEIYVWVPRFGSRPGNKTENEPDKYSFCYDTTNYRIYYGTTGDFIKDTYDNTKYNINGYFIKDKLNIKYTVSEEFGELTGKWVKVNSKLNPIDETGNEITDETNILNMLKTLKFEWN